MDGDIECTEFILTGRAEIHGSIRASHADLNGNAALEGSLRSGRIRVHGRVNINGDLTGKTIQVNGALTVKGICETGKSDASRRLQMNGLNAGNIHIMLNSHSQIGEIEGEHINIRRQPGVDFPRWLKVLPIPLRNRLTAQTIEGDHIYIEYTTASAVRGTNVGIGPGCEVGLVEYKTKFDQDKSAKVEKLEQI